VHWYLGWVLLMKEAYADALPPLLRASAQSSEADVLSKALLGFAYARLGNRESAQEIAGALADQYRSSYASPVWIAFLHLGLGDRGEALRWLARACDDRDGWLRLIKAPFFDELHGTPEFARVLTTLGLEAPHPAG
jgi:hypothetical protein